MTIAPGTTDPEFEVTILDDDGSPVTGLVAATFPPVYYSKAGPTARVQITLVDLASLAAAHVDGGVKEKGGGQYRLCGPDAMVATAGNVMLVGDATDKHLLHAPIEVRNPVQVVPLATTVEPPRFTTAGGTVLNLAIAENASTDFTFAVFDSDDAAVDLSGKVLRFVVHDKDGLVKFVLESVDGEVTLGGADDNEVAVVVTEDETTTANVGGWFYKLWNVTDRDVLASGSFQIRRAPISAA